MLIGYLLLMNALSFWLMLTDKQKARKKKWRIPESTLFIFAVLGGSVGVLAGMCAFRHKTKRPKFTIGIPLILAAQTILYIMLVTTIL